LDEGESACHEDSRAQSFITRQGELHVEERILLQVQPMQVQKWAGLVASNQAHPGVVTDKNETPTF
jgi:hypothetical protein